MQEYWHIISDEHQQKLKTITEEKSVSLDTAMRNIVNFLKQDQNKDPSMPEYLQELVTAKQIEETIDMIAGNGGAHENCKKL